jgi:hypothetical protein
MISRFQPLPCWPVGLSFMPPTRDFRAAKAHQIRRFAVAVRPAAAAVFLPLSRIIV